jgi:16S rRNA (guanine527-N7)-methyltransferase
MLNCAVVAELVPRPSHLVDIGSGAGLPGIVLALMLPDVSVTLLEPTLRRERFLSECIAELGLENASVRRARAEEVAGKISADVATARAVARLDRLAGWALGVVRPGGVVLAIKGASAEGELADARPILRRLGVREIEVLAVGSGKVEPAATVVRFTSPRARSRGIQTRSKAPGLAGAERYSKPD